MIGPWFLLQRWMVRCVGALLLAIVAGESGAVRLNADGHGQVLIYPYYTTRSSFASGSAFVSALSVTNTTSKPKALKVRFREARAGAEVLAFNLFLDSRDTWTAGVVATNSGAVVSTTDRSCTVPAFLPSLPLGNANYVGDGIDDSLDRTFDGYIEVYEMATIDASTPLGRSIVHSVDTGKPGLARPSCSDLPQTDVTPIGLSKPSGGLVGAISYLNVNEGIDMTVSAVALAGWSDRMQWSGSASAVPNLATASPPTSSVVVSTETGDTLYVSQWNNGRDAVTATLMATGFESEFTVESSIKAATDLLLTMPTRPFYVDRDRAELPFRQRNFQSTAFNQETVCCAPNAEIPYCDREGQCDRICFDFIVCLRSYSLRGVAAAATFTANGGGAIVSNIFSSVAPMNIALNSIVINGHFPFRPDILEGGVVSAGLLKAPATRTAAIDLASGTVRPNLNVTYRGFPMIGFVATSYSTTGLPSVSPSIFSNYGGQSTVRYIRSVDVTQ